jgi:error-prone DNA polymerase
MSISMIGIDTAKSIFHLHGVDARGEVQRKRKLRRDELAAFFERQPRCTVVMEACGAAHHWARVLGGLGHEVKLIASEATKPFVKRGKKNDPADAAAIRAAASRPDAKFVAVKSLEQQGVLALHSVRSLLVKQETMLANAMRGLAAEFGLVVPKGMDKLERLWRWWRRTRAFRSRHAKPSSNCAGTVAPRRSGSRAWSGGSSRTLGTTTRLGAWPRSPASGRSPPR